MVTDDDILEKEDMYILGRMKEFASHEDVVTFAAAKQLLILIERAVCPHSPVLAAWPSSEMCE